MSTLTISIPTYNRPLKCMNLLTKISSNHLIQHYIQLKKVTIVVSDNCSIEPYDEVEKYCGKTGFEYIKQKNNMGLVGNVIFCLKNTKSEYAWIIGDDDNIDFDVVKEIFKEIKKEPTIILLNHTAIDKDGEIIVESMYSNNRNESMDITKIGDNNGGLMFIGANVYSRAEAIKYVNKYSHYLAFPFYLSLNCIKNGKIGFVPDIMIKNIWGESSWKKLSSVVCNLQQPYLLNMVEIKGDLLFKEIKKYFINKINFRTYLRALMTNFLIRFKNPELKIQTLSITEVLSLFNWILSNKLKRNK